MSLGGKGLKVCVCNHVRMFTHSSGWKVRGGTGGIKHMWWNKDSCYQTCGDFRFSYILFAVQSMTLRHCAQNTWLIANILHYKPTQEYTELQQELQLHNSVSARTLLPAVHHGVGARTLPSAVQVSIQEHYCQLCKYQYKNTTVSCASQCKNTTVSCTSINTRTLLLAAQVSIQENYCQLSKSV
jgi:hypothetical protein